MLWSLPLIPLAAGGLLWLLQVPKARLGDAFGTERRERLLLGGSCVLALVVTLAVAVWAALASSPASLGWGPGLTLVARVDPLAGVVAVLVPVVAAPIVAYAAAHEPRRGLVRLVALLVLFVAAMELLVVADDLLTLLIGWELVAAASWALIAHQWWEADKPSAASHAFLATRGGGLGLFAAAMAAFAGTGSLRYADLSALDGPLLHVVAAGVVVAAAAKSAQVPFSPWLFSAMAGPTPVSALLHAATMVAAGAYVLARLAEPLSRAAWFGPAVIAVGLITALAGGVVAGLQDHAKKLLAASTSAQYGLMFVAIGAGSATVAVAHLVTHAILKALLFLAAGVAVSAVGSGSLGRMRLGSRLRAVALASAAGALSLAGVPPLSGAWTKERIVTVADEVTPWLAVLVAVAGGLSAFYATRFHVLAFGPAAGHHVAGGQGDTWDLRDLPGPAETGALGVLAALTVGLGVLWLPGAAEVAGGVLGGDIPSGPVRERLLSLALVALGAYAALVLDRARRLAALGAGRLTRPAADWLGIPATAKATIVDPTLALCAVLARFDDRVIDAGVRGVARLAQVVSGRAARFDERVVDAGVRATAAFGEALSRLLARFSEGGIDGTVRAVAGGIGSAARASRRLQTGLSHHSYVIITLGLVALVVAAAVWR